MPLSHPAMVLGLAGLVPFVAMTAFAVAGPVTGYVYWLTALSHYGAVILTFVGALHWGYALKRGAQDEVSWLQYGYSVVPALLAWFSLFFDVWVALRMQAAALMACYIFDLAMARVDPVTDRFLKLRAALTLTGTGSLVYASLA